MRTLLTCLLLIAAIHLPAHAQRLKDVASVSGVNSNSLTGYGLVAGLPGTGDSSGALSSPMVLNLLQNLGQPVSAPRGMNNRNLAVVAVTAELPALARSGDPLDVRVASLGDAKSLEGGTLLLSLLRGPDGKLYASAQGPVTSLGSTLERRGGKPAVVGMVPRGGTVAQDVSTPALRRDRITWVLATPDFGTARRVADGITALGWPATATGPQTVDVQVGTSDPVQACAAMGEISVALGGPARVICDRRTGTVVVGQDVHLRPAVVSHRGVTVEIGLQGTSLRALVESLKQGGATPEDVIAVLQLLHEAGALTGEIQVR
ncbi:MAG: flagellar basal body P-ring protein FlgI [Candidatus Eremiobacterota bacterium]